MVKNAVNEMRRYYSRKVVDVLIKVTRRTLDLIIKPFSAEALVSTDGKYIIRNRKEKEVIPLWLTFEEICNSTTVHDPWKTFDIFNPHWTRTTVYNLNKTSNA